MLDKFALMKYNITYMASAVVADAIETKKKSRVMWVICVLHK